MCNGAKPILSDSLSVRIVYLINVGKELNININLDISSNLDPSAWIRKYLTDASVSWNVEDDTISGINAKRFNSSIIHINNQFVLDMANMVLVNSNV
jgi:hypothetical protein